MVKEIRKEEIAGVRLGGQGRTTADIIRDFKLLGFDTNRISTISELRHRKTSGALIGEKINCTARFSNNDASLKDNLYLRVAQTGVMIRRQQKNIERKHCFSSHEFTVDIAIRISSGMVRADAQLIHSAVRAMRLELVLEAGILNCDSIDTFTRTARQYISDYKFKSDHKTPQKHPLQFAVILDNEWLGTIPNFYHLLQSQSGSSTIGSWPPYELGFFDGFYEDRIDCKSALSSFDRHVLESYLRGESPTYLAAKLRGETGLTVYQNDIAVHRNALTLGKFVNPDFQRPVRS